VTVKKNKLKYIVFVINVVCGVMSYDLEGGDGGYLPTNKLVTTYSICCKGGRLFKSLCFLQNDFYCVHVWL
jgi:hypothetical protein